MATTGWAGETSIRRNRNAARSLLERESGRNLRGASGVKSGEIMRSFTVTPKRPKSRLQFRLFQAFYRRNDITARTTRNGFGETAGSANDTKSGKDDRFGCLSPCTPVSWRENPLPERNEKKGFPQRRSRNEVRRSRPGKQTQSFYLDATDAKQRPSKQIRKREKCIGGMKPEENLHASHSSGFRFPPLAFSFFPSAISLFQLSAFSL
jgi:hypothetical protein